MESDPVQNNTLAGVMLVKTGDQPAKSVEQRAQNERQPRPTGIVLWDSYKVPLITWNLFAEFRL